ALLGAPSSGAPRLVTLTGAGGSGKTRLALEVAARQWGPFRGAVWFVSLQDLSDARLIPYRVRDALHLPHLAEIEPVEQLAAALARQPSLLLLDNFEHLALGGTPFLEALLERVPGLMLLVTS